MELEALRQLPREERLPALLREQAEKYGEAVAIFHDLDANEATFVIGEPEDVAREVLQLRENRQCMGSMIELAVRDDLDDDWEIPDYSGVKRR